MHEFPSLWISSKHATSSDEIQFQLSGRFHPLDGMRFPTLRLAIARTYCLCLKTKQKPNDFSALRHSMCKQRHLFHRTSIHISHPCPGCHFTFFALSTDAITRLAHLRLAASTTTSHHHTSNTTDYSTRPSCAALEARRPHVSL